MRVVLFVSLVLCLAGGMAAEEHSENEFNPEEIEQLVAEWDEFTSRMDKEQLITAIDPEGNKEFDLERFGEFDPEEKAELARDLQKIQELPFMAGATVENLWLTVVSGYFVRELAEQAERMELLIIVKERINERHEEALAEQEQQIRDLETKLPENAPYVVGESEYDRFALWTGCHHLLPWYHINGRLIFFGRVAETTFEKSIVAAVESRLRGTRLYPRDKGQIDVERLDIFVSQGGGNTFSFEISLNKHLVDPSTGLRRGTKTSEGYWGYGTGPLDYIRSALADQLDRFIADYLRVNADSC